MPIVTKSIIIATGIAIAYEAFHEPQKQNPHPHEGQFEQDRFCNAVSVYHISNRVPVFVTRFTDTEVRLVTME